tara:strand:- start:289 stop:501 length:213 start_codon:yes stop_codon:yes gene_type:complete
MSKSREEYMIMIERADRITEIAESYFNMAHDSVKTYLELKKFGAPNLAQRYVRLSNHYTDRGYSLMKLVN